MACCVIASFIIAQCIAILRRWGMFWGLVAVPAGESVDTIYRKLRSNLNSSTGRAAVFCVVATEVALLVGWIYVDHGEHIREFVDIQWSQMHGETVIYSGYCTQDGPKRARLLVPAASRG